MSQEATGSGGNKPERAGGAKGGGGGGMGGLNPLAVLGLIGGHGAGASAGSRVLQSLLPMAAGLFLPGQGPGRGGGGGRGNSWAGAFQQGQGGNVMPYPGQFYRHGNVEWQVPQWSPMPSPGFNTFLNAMYGRFGQPSAGYQAFLQALQERRDARMGVPAPPPQGAASPSAQRQSVPSMNAGQRSY